MLNGMIHNDRVRIVRRGNTYAYPDADGNCDTDSHVNCNPAADSDTKGYSNTQASPDSTPSPDPVEIIAALI